MVDLVDKGFASVAPEMAILGIVAAVVGGLVIFIAKNYARKFGGVMMIGGGIFTSMQFLPYL